jgi:hypothetical protein
LIVEDEEFFDLSLELSGTKKYISSAMENAKRKSQKRE